MKHVPPLGPRINLHLQSRKLDLALAGLWRSRSGDDREASAWLHEQYFLSVSRKLDAVSALRERRYFPIGEAELLDHSAAASKPRGSRGAARNYEKAAGGTCFEAQMRPRRNRQRYDAIFDVRQVYPELHRLRLLFGMRRF